MTLKQLLKPLSYFNSNITEENFPKQKVRGKVEIISYDKTMTSEEVILALENKGLEPANLDELLTWNLANPKNRGFVIALGSVWTDSVGGRYVPFLNEWGGERELNLGWFDDEWGGRCRFAAVRKSSENGNLSTPEFESFDPLLLEFSYNGKKYKVVSDD